MASQSTKLRSLYRSVLRELPPRPILASPRPPLHLRLREHFGSSSVGAAGADAERAIVQAEQYLAYLRAQRVYVTLLERYNPGMNMDEKERVRLSARRIGMNLPLAYDPGKQQV